MRLTGRDRPARGDDVRPVGGGLLGAGIADQVVIALANAANSLLALLLLPDRGRAGILVLSLAIGYVVVSLNRAFVGEVLLAIAARHGDAERERLVRDGLTTALSVAVLAAALLTAVWGVTERLGLPGPLDLRDLIWIAVVLPPVLVHDTARFSYLAERHPGRALAIDVTYVLVQGLAVLALAVTGEVTPGRLVVCWGLGATAGFALFAVRTGQLPWRGDPRRWVAETRFLSGWFTATAVIGQVHVLAVTFLIGARLSASALAAFRLVQVTLLQPVQNLNQALTSLFVPRVAQLAGADASRAVRREVGRAAAILAGLAGLLVAVGGGLAQLVLPLIPRYADTAPLAWPILVQGGIYLVQTPFSAALRGLHRGRMLFGQYVIFSVLSLTALIVGSTAAGLVGAAWGLAVGAALGLIMIVGLYLRALRR